MNKVPFWVQDAIFYQIFPDRFHNSDPGNDPPNTQTWGTKPTLRGFQGGDLRGIEGRPAHASSWRRWGGVRSERSTAMTAALRRPDSDTVRSPTTLAPVPP